MQRRTITIDVSVDDRSVDTVLAELVAAARRFDARARAVVDDARLRRWTELSFVAVDVETTGFDPARDRVIEVAWVHFERGREVGRFASLLCVDVDIPAPVRALTGIVPSMLADKPRFRDVCRDLVDALTSADFAVAYNAGFDRSFLAAELGACSASLPAVPWVDPLAFLRELDDGSHASKKLAHAARRFGVALADAHRAENDARATGELLLKLAPRLSAQTLAELVDLEARWTRTADEPKGIGARLLSLFR